MYSYEKEIVERDENTVHMNVGPSHPAMHGTLRVKMEVKGERIIRTEQEIGFLHTGFEKLGEYRSYNQFITLTDRLNYFSPLSNNIGFALASEELLGITVPRRCQVIRTILAEMSRLADHSLCVGAMTMDLGAFTSILWTFVEREKLYDVFEAVTGTRLTSSYTRVGGLAFDLPADFEKRVTSILDSMDETLDKLRGSFYKNRIFLDRTEGIGVITKEMAMSYGITGPMGRASGVPYDIRKFRPYMIYNELKFETPVYTEGDTLARYKVRIDEMAESISLVRQAMKLLEPGPINHRGPEAHASGQDLDLSGHGIADPPFQAGDAGRGSRHPRSRSPTSIPPPRRPTASWASISCPTAPPIPTACASARPLSSTTPY